MQSLRLCTWLIENVCYLLLLYTPPLKPHRSNTFPTGHTGVSEAITPQFILAQVGAQQLSSAVKAEEMAALRPKFDASSG